MHTHVHVQAHTHVHTEMVICTQVHMYAYVCEGQGSQVSSTFFIFFVSHWTGIHQGGLVVMPIYPPPGSNLYPLSYKASILLLELSPQPLLLSPHTHTISVSLEILLGHSP